MIRSIFAVAIAIVVIAPVAYAQAPTPAQIEKAKKAFGEGKKAFDAGDFPEAIQKFKESYNLSKNPKLLYNVAIANESAGQDDIALFYYRKFLTDAAPDDAQRADAETRKMALELKFGGGGTTAPTPPAGGNVTTPPAGGNTTGTEPTPPTPAPVKKQPLVCKPPGTYQADAFKHQVVDIAPPKKTLDITAAVPEDACFVVTLYFRTSGESKFTAKEMKARYNDLVGRIPPAKMIGDSIQYYIEVKDSAGTVVTRSAKSTSPNLVELQAGAPERYFPDFSEEGEVATPTAAQTTATDTEEDPLNRNKKKQIVDDESNGGGGVVVNAPPGNGFRDVGSSKFKYAKWGSTIAGVGLVGLGVVFHISAGNQARALEEDIMMCGAPPCREFDNYAKDVEAAGKRNQTLSRVSFGVGGVAVLVAGYFWYKELTAKKRGESRMTAKASPEKTSLSTLQIAPALPVGNEGFTGLSAGLQF